jgi:hypothetical protein
MLLAHVSAFLDMRLTLHSPSDGERGEPEESMSAVCSASRRHSPPALTAILPHPLPYPWGKASCENPNEQCVISKNDFGSPPFW